MGSGNKRMKDIPLWLESIARWGSQAEIYAIHDEDEQKVMCDKISKRASCRRMAMPEEIHGGWKLGSPRIVKRNSIHWE